MEVNTSFGPIDIAISGLRAQSKKMEVISSNVANAQTTDNGQGEPYRRLEAVLKTDGSTIGGVTLDEITTDMSDFPKILRPGHSDADEQGYVTMPNVNLPMEMISSNVANAQTTDNGEGQPYRRLEAILKADGDTIGGVSLDEITMDMSDLPKILKPGHPNADEQGYVTMPNVNLPTEMMNLKMAARAYQANTAILRRYQEMMETTLELLK